MSNLKDFPAQGDDAWTFDIPSAEPCRLFLAEHSRTPEQVWLMTHDGKATDDLALFARVLTLDLQQEMLGNVQEKLNMLAGVAGNSFRMGFPYTDEKQMMKGQVSAIAKLLLYRGGFMMTDTPEARQQHKGDIWSVDVLNPYSQKIFTIKISEPMVDVRKRPFSIWLSGDYPEILDGLCALLSADMAGADLSRIAIKIKALIDPQPSAEGTLEYRLSNFSPYIAYVLLNRYVTHFCMDKRVNVLPYTNVVSIEANSSSNDRGFSNLRRCSESPRGLPLRWLFF